MACLGPFGDVLASDLQRKLTKMCQNRKALSLQKLFYVARQATLKLPRNRLDYAQMQVLVVQILANLKWVFGHNSAPRSRTELKIGGNSSQ